ncbi:peptidoglycan DD-metalloendopeptidase family protein [Leptobacterium flavescens]|uniref:Peptidoglycan DD-metalloendopeptidase family protein n=1 Tax=Leptobacterium flavescens TaxID=472055 RepID=A0A6P0UQ75_9FLAO|nr:M23 family metallopeptidase [Leptobacterium flavescens]NER15491.1 peptidoglycan DD-metalloendopeptidase family protein [Leptobacterium flavescens]
MRKLLFFLLFISTGLNAQGISHFREVQEDTVYIGLRNNYYAPYNFKLELKKEYEYLGIRYKDYFVIAANDSISNVLALPVKKLKEIGKLDLNNIFHLNNTMGDPANSDHDDNYLYALPYKKGKTYKVTQGFNGKKSHRSVRSKYAIDFNLRIGDTVCAAREGIVALVQKDFTEHGGREYINKANRIIILHSDGTTASYVHLDYQGTLVKPGEHVKKGQPIGISGLTGFTGGPHLHFVVREAGDISVPVYFEAYENKILKKRKSYTRPR